MESIRIGQPVIYQGRLHTVASISLGRIAGPHARLVCGPSCPETCDAGTLTSINLLSPAPVLA